MGEFNFFSRYLSKSNHSDISVYNTTYAGRTMHCFYSQMLKLSIAWQTEKKHFQDNGKQNKRIRNTPQRHIHPFILWRTRHAGSLNNQVV